MKNGSFNDVCKNPVISMFALATANYANALCTSCSGSRATATPVECCVLNQRTTARGARRNAGTSFVEIRFKVTEVQE